MYAERTFVRQEMTKQDMDTLETIRELHKRMKEELDKIRLEMDKNSDGKITKEEMIARVNDEVRNLGQSIIGDSKNLVSRLAEDVRSGTISKEQFNSEISQYKSDVKGRMQEFWYGLLVAVGTLITGYAGKQAVSSRSKADFQARLSVIEKLTGLSLQDRSVSKEHGENDV